MMLETSSVSSLLAGLSPSITLLLLAIAAERLLPINYRYHPFNLLALLNTQLASKVNNGAIKQQRLAGALLTTLLTSTILLLIWLCTQIVLFPSLFEGVLLLCCIQSRDVWQSWKQVQGYLSSSAQDSAASKAKAITALSQLTLRDLQPLSQYGLQKSASETLSQRLVTHWFAVILWYLVGGIYLALLHRILITIAQSNNRKLTEWRELGAFSATLYRLLCWPAYLLVSITLTFYGPVRASFKYGVTTAKTWHYQAAGLFLGVLAFNAKAEFGGPRVYIHQPLQPLTLTNAVNKTRIVRIVPPGVSAVDTLNLPTFNKVRTLMRHSSQIWLFLLMVSLLLPVIFSAIH